MKALVCSTATPPTKDRECPAAIYSRGGECKSCPRDDCHRQGWSKQQATTDNKRRTVKQ